MWKNFSAALLEANKWGQIATPGAVGQALGDIAFALAKLFFALTYFLIGLTFILVGSLEDLFTKKRGEVGEKREKKLKTHLDWDREDESRRNPALRR